MKQFTSRNLSAAVCLAVASLAAPSSFGGGTCPPDINNDSIVNVSDLLTVVQAWGPCTGSCQPDIAPGNGDGVVNTSDLLAVVGAWGQCAGSGSPPLTPSGPILLQGGATTVANFAITGVGGIAAGNGTNVTLLTINNCTINVDNAGIYAAPCQQAIVTNTQVVASGGLDPYSVRGMFTSWTSSDCSFGGDKAWRIYGLTGGSSTRDVFTGGRVLCGGGAANEWNGALDFDNFTFRDGRISVDSVEIHAASNNITFRNMDFDGTDHISIHGPAHHITFEHCRHPDGHYLTQADVGSYFIRLYNNPTNIQVIP
jgi:hypothetical protein